jgi:hypothetical protein
LVSVWETSVVRACALLVVVVASMGALAIVVGLASVLFGYLLYLGGPVHFIMLFEDPRSAVFICLVHDAGLLKVTFKLLKALEASELNLTSLLGIEFDPLPPIEFLEEVKDEDRVNEVQECVADIRFVSEINRQVKEVILPLVSQVNLLEQQPLSVLVRDVPNHECRTLVLTTEDLVQVELEGMIETCLRAL